MSTRSVIVRVGEADGHPGCQAHRQGVRPAGRSPVGLSANETQSTRNDHGGEMKVVHFKTEAAAHVTIRNRAGKKLFDMDFAGSFDHSRRPSGRGE